MLSTFLSILLSIFTPPVDYDISLAGNFGEPRPHHFHGGLDVKTDNVEGKHIYAIADGYISRITVGLYGFGNAVYITHPTGHTSVYCHLKAFSPRIKAALRRYQYRHKTCVADAHLTPLDVPVSAGQFIALSGNTGHSTGPHLHLEVHDTRTWDMLDPYEMLADFINDSVAPQAHAFMAIPQHDGLFNGSSQKQNFGFSSHHLEREFTAWGRVGFALWGNDYMQGTYNHYGIRYTTLLVDGQIVFRSDVSRVPMSLNRMVNVWGDYLHYRHSNVWYMKSFLEPGCRLPILWADEQRGIVAFNEERPYRLDYILRDYCGNESHYSFTVLERPEASSNAYMFTTSSLPLLADAELSIYLLCQGGDPTKYFLTNEQGRYLGGEFHDGWVTGQIRELCGLYQLAYDDQPPTITPLSLGQRLALSVSDVGSGIATWTASVDDRFIVFDALEKSSTYACDLRESWLRPTGRPHRLHFEVTDNRLNTRVYETTFNY